TRELWVSPPGLRGACAAELLHVARERGVQIRTARRGQMLSASGFPLRILAAGRRFKRSPDNNASIVLMTWMGRRRILLTGDIEKDAERSLVGGDLRADILKVAHHGSRSSTTSEFLSAVSPRLALISAGRRNLYGHPHLTVIEALDRKKAIIRRTDEHGTIRVRIDPRNTLRIETEIDTFRATAYSR
ncbi:MAG TPA: hypothetical protein VFL80_01985, partial [Thermoanaerobaculia bacterium]|nr:hypothetical protein [Thermoanaerobaculia bacterium]